MLQTSVLSIMYISAVGYGMVFGGIYIEAISDVENTDDIDDDLVNGQRLLFAGGFLTTLFWVSYEEYSKLFCLSVIHLISH